jgi:HK97 family phage major capsid protein
MLSAIEARLDDAIRRYEAQVRDAGSAASETRAEVRALSDQVAELSKRVERRSHRQQHSIGQRVVEAKEWQAWARGELSRARVELSGLEIRNTLTSGGGGGLVQEQRIPGVVPGATQPTDLIDIVPAVPTQSNAVEIVRELSRRNNAAGVAEGAAKPESDITLETVTYPVRTIATWMRVSRQLAQDEPAIAAYLDARLATMIREKVSQQMLTGTGANDLAGVYTTGQYTVYTPTASDTLYDAITRAYHLLWQDGYRADVAIVNPGDFGGLKISKGSDQHYVFAPGVLEQSLPVRIVMHPSMAAGQFLVGAFSTFTAAFWREGITVEAFEQDADNARHNLVTLRAEVRLAFAVLRPAAFLGGQIAP